MGKNFRNLTFYLLIIMVAVSLINHFMARNDPVEKLLYSDFLAKLQAGEVKSATIIGQELMRGKLKDGTEFELAITPADTELMTLIKEHVPNYDVEPPPTPPWWTSIVTYGLMFVIFLGAWFFLMQQTQGGGNRVMSFGKSRAKLYTQPKKRITFEDVAGYEEVKEEVSEIVEFLKHPKKFIDMGARIPKGVLLFGPPGTGKTLLARAIAGEAGVPFFSISGSEFVEMFVGVGASRVRDLFDTAKKNAPCIVFIDEMDAVGRQRGAGLGGGHDEREQTLNELLVQMDGFDVNEGLIVIAGTNRPDILDPALLRPGRFDRHIMVGKPDIRDRESILKVHTRGKKLSSEVDLSVLARRTPGFTGADLENLINEAALLAARRDKRRIEMEELEESINRVLAGPEKKNPVISEREKRLVAYHEAGHALTGHLLPNTDEVHMVSIIPRGQAGGYTIMLPKEDRQFVTKLQFLDMVTHLLGGRAAEELVLGDISTGAQNDLERATQIARKMITEYGMSPNLGPRTFGHKEEQVFLGRDLTTGHNYSEEVAQAIDNEIKNIIDGCYEKAKCILKENHGMLDRIAKELMRRETLRREDLNALFEELEKSETNCEKEEAGRSKPMEPLEEGI